MIIGARELGLNDTKKNRAEQIHEIIGQTGFGFPDSIIHLFVGGSEAHGAKVHGYDDLDLYGVYIEPPELALGVSDGVVDASGRPLSNKIEHFVWSTAGDERKNTKDDVDLALYSLRKWARMAAKGNATALHFLFTPNIARNRDAWEKWIRPNAHAFLSRQAGFHFQKFAEDQLRRLHGIGTGEKGLRLDLIERHGYDTKAAMHTIRLLHEGIELMRTGFITLPRPEKELLITIRTGQFGSLSEVDRLAADLFKELDETRQNSALPEEPNRREVSRIVSSACLEFWRLAGLG